MIHKVEIALGVVIVVAGALAGMFFSMNYRDIGIWFTWLTIVSAITVGFVVLQSHLWTQDEAVPTPAPDHAARQADIMAEQLERSKIEQSPRLTFDTPHMEPPALGKLLHGTATIRNTGKLPATVTLHRVAAEPSLIRKETTFTPHSAHPKNDCSIDYKARLEELADMARFTEDYFTILPGESHSFEWSSAQVVTPMQLDRFNQKGVGFALVTYAEYLDPSKEMFSTASVFFYTADSGVPVKLQGYDRTEKDADKPFSWFPVIPWNVNGNGPLVGTEAAEPGKMAASDRPRVSCETAEVAEPTVGQPLGVTVKVKNSGVSTARVKEHGSILFSLLVDGPPEDAGRAFKRSGDVLDVELDVEPILKGLEDGSAKDPQDYVIAPGETARLVMDEKRPMDQSVVDSLKNKAIAAIIVVRLVYEDICGEKYLVWTALLYNPNDGHAYSIPRYSHMD